MLADAKGILVESGGAGICTLAANQTRKQIGACLCCSTWVFPFSLGGLWTPMLVPSWKGAFACKMSCLCSVWVSITSHNSGEQFQENKGLHILVYHWQAHGRQLRNYWTILFICDCLSCVRLCTQRTSGTPLSPRPSQVPRRGILMSSINPCIYNPQRSVCQLSFPWIIMNQSSSKQCIQSSQELIMTSPL